MVFKNILFLIVSLFMIVSFAVAVGDPLEGRIIALDAGHGGTSLGAQYPAGCADDGDASDCQIFEKDVNLDVVRALEVKLKELGALVVLTRENDETIPTQKERVDLAIQKCREVDVNGDFIQDDKKCDVLISIHHNGNIDSSHDGTLAIYTQNSDKPLAKAMLESLVSLTDKNEGMLKGGYGMTVYGNLVSTLTEAYYITNDSEAISYLNGTRVAEEVDAQITGLSNYFASQTSGRGGKPK